MTLEGWQKIDLSEITVVGNEIHIRVMNHFQSVKTNEKLKRKRPSKCAAGKSTQSKKRSAVVPMKRRKNLIRTKNAESDFVSKELQLSEESSDGDIC